MFASALASAREMRPSRLVSSASKLAPALPDLSWSAATAVPASGTSAAAAAAMRVFR
jgi:hypothetical protein